MGLSGVFLMAHFRVKTTQGADYRTYTASLQESKTWYGMTFTFFQRTQKNFTPLGQKSWESTMLKTLS